MKAFIVLIAVLLLAILLAGPKLAEFFGPTNNAVEVAQAQAVIEAARGGQIAAGGLAATALVNSLTVFALVLILLAVVVTGAILLVRHYRPAPKWQPGPNANFGRTGEARRIAAPRPAQAALPPGQPGGQWVYMPGQTPVQQVQPQPQPQIYYIQEPDSENGEVEW